MIVKTALLIVSICVSSSLLAAPTVIYDAGNTESIASYTDIIKIYNPKKKLPLKVFNPLPIVTPNLTPGLVTKRTINQPYLSNPMFIFGSDPFSLKWLQNNKPLLQRINAIGILVNVETEEQLKRIVIMGKGLKIIPAPAVDLAKQLKLTHYPVLISKQHIEQ